MGFSLGGALGGGLLGGGMGATIGGLKDSLFGMKQYDATSTNAGRSSTTRNPYGPLGPQLDYSLSQARNLYDSGVNPWISQANQLQAQRALMGGGLTPQAKTMVSSTINGDYLSPNSNPYFAENVNDALGMAKSQFNSQYGGPAGQNVNNSGFQEALARGLGSVATNAYANNYAQERQNQMAAIPFAPGLDSQDYLNIGALYNAGLQQQQAPWSNLAAYQAAFTPALNFGTQDSNYSGTATQPFFENRTAETLGALLGGGALVMGMPRSPFGGGTGGGGFGMGPSNLMG